LWVFFYVHFSRLDFQDLKKVNAAKPLEKFYHCVLIGVLWYNHGFFPFLYVAMGDCKQIRFCFMGDGASHFTCGSLEKQGNGNNINTKSKSLFPIIALI